MELLLFPSIQGSCFHAAETIYPQNKPGTLARVILTRGCGHWEKGKTLNSVQTNSSERPSVSLNNRLMDCCSKTAWLFYSSSLLEEKNLTTNRSGFFARNGIFTPNLAFVVVRSGIVVVAVRRLVSRYETSRDKLRFLSPLLKTMSPPTERRLHVHALLFSERAAFRSLWKCPLRLTGRLSGWLPVPVAETATGFSLLVVLPSRMGLAASVSALSFRSTFAANPLVLLDLNSAAGFWTGIVLARGFLSCSTSSPLELPVTGRPLWW